MGRLVKHAIILAAGYGSRLAERGKSKPLVRVAGMTLIEMGIHQAIAAGVEEVRVVTGHEAELVEAELSAISERTGARIVPVRLDDWSKPNGWSVIAGAQVLDGPFLLMMADHIFGDGILAALAGEALKGRDVILATDSIDSPLVDPDDATWVETGKAGRIRHIGKTIATYDRVDCGAFLANAALPEAIEQAIAKGKRGSLSDGIQVLADRGRAGTMDIKGCWWIDVDDPRAHDLAESQAAQHLGVLAEVAVEGAGLAV